MSPFDHFGAKKEMGTRKISIQCEFANYHTYSCVVNGGIGMSSSIGFPLQCTILDEWTNFSAVRGVACRSNKMKLWTNNQLLLLLCMPIMYYVCRWQIALLRMQCRAQSPEPYIHVTRNVQRYGFAGSVRRSYWSLRFPLGWVAVEFFVFTCKFFFFSFSSSSTISGHMLR